MTKAIAPTAWGATGATGGSVSIARAEDRSRLTGGSVPLAGFLFEYYTQLRVMRISESSLREKRLETFSAFAKGAGVKLTHQRLEIFRELARTEEHPDAESIFRAVKRRMPTVSLDTVYRTLWMLYDHGLITTLGPRRDGLRFDVNLERHHHYVCVRCGLVRDFESDDLNGLRVPDAVQKLGSVVDARVEVSGLCTKCQKAKTGSKERPRPKQKQEKRRTEP